MDESNFPKDDGMHANDQPSNNPSICQSNKTTKIKHRKLKSQNNHKNHNSNTERTSIPDNDDALNNQSQTSNTEKSNSERKPNDPFDTSVYACMHQDCETSCFHKTDLLSHLTEVHNVKVEPFKELSFANRPEFYEWRETVEVDTYSSFVRTTPPKTWPMRYCCQMNGTEKEQPLRKILKRKRGSTKTEGCIAMMKVNIDEDGRLIVLYYPTHSHEMSKRNFLYKPFTEKMEQELKELNESNKVSDVLMDKKIVVTDHVVIKRIYDSEYADVDIYAPRQRMGYYGMPAMGVFEPLPPAEREQFAMRLNHPERFDPPALEPNAAMEMEPLEEFQSSEDDSGCSVQAIRNNLEENEDGRARLRLKMVQDNLNILMRMFKTTAIPYYLISNAESVLTNLLETIEACVDPFDEELL